MLLITDSFSKWPEAFPLENATAIETAKVLYRQFFCRFGLCARLVTDRGTHFANSLIKAICDMFQIKHHFTTPYHPQTNSSAERFFSFLSKSIRNYIRRDQNNWPNILSGILMAYRKTPATESTEFSPYYLLFSQHMRTPIDIAIDQENNVHNLPPNYRHHLQSVIENVKLCREIATENMEYHKVKSAEYYNRNAIDPDYKIGDMVWLKSERVPIGMTSKLHFKWSGPYVITEKGDNNFTYRLRNVDTDVLTNTFINAARIKRALLPNESAIRRNEHIERPVIRQRLSHQNTQHQDLHEVISNDQQVDPQLMDEQNDRNKEIERIINVQRNNRGLYYQVKFKDDPKSKWYLEGSLNIPKDMIDDVLQRRTLRGTPRHKRRKRK